MKPLVLPPLPYSLEELEPVISAEIMKLHYTKHHQAYVDNFNAALTKLKAAEDSNDLNAMIALQGALKFNGGGDINHSIFWTNLAPVGKGGEPSSALARAIETSFGSFDSAKEALSKAGLGVQGSGWAWLAYDPVTRRVVITTCANQDPLQPLTGLVPLLGIDVWEHAYYLQYKNARAEYLKSIWQVINWTNVSERLSSVIS